MPTLDDTKFNELAIVARHNGQLGVWKGWKRDIGAFTDPQMWRDTSRYDQYFERLDSSDWDLAGYGVIVMDLDTKTVWSFNDYSSPWSFFLPEPHNFKTNPKAEMWFNALFADPASWADFEVKVAKLDLKVRAGRPPSYEDLTLEQLLGGERDPDKCMQMLTAQRGELKHGDATYLALGGRHVPKDWTVGCEIGEDGPGGLLNALITWRDTGFPPPRSWDAIDDYMGGSGEYPISDEAFAGFPDEFEEEDPALHDEMHKAYDLATRYRTLREEWTGVMGASAPRPKM